MVSSTSQVRTPSASLTCNVSSVICSSMASKFCSLANDLIRERNLLIVLFINSIERASSSTSLILECNASGLLKSNRLIKTASSASFCSAFEILLATNEAIGIEANKIPKVIRREVLTILMTSASSSSRGESITNVSSRPLLPVTLNVRTAPCQSLPSC